MKYVCALAIPFQSVGLKSFVRHYDGIEIGFVDTPLCKVMLCNVQGT